MSDKPRRARRCQLAVPGSSEKMMAKAAGCAADQVFLDLEDAVAPKAKPAARAQVVAAINSLDWGKKTLSVRINDVGTPWCFDDVIAIVEGAHARVDTLIVPKVMRAQDVAFVATLLDQIEKKLGLAKRIGLELLIEEVDGLSNVDAIAKASPRTESLIFGMGDYSASHGIDVRSLSFSAAGSYPGDIWYYPRFRIVMAARAAGIDAVDGPFANFHDEPAYREECRRALILGCVGKWAIHPSQIIPAQEAFTPGASDIARAREIASAYAKAEAEGVGSVNIGGMMVDAATVRILANVLRRAETLGL